MAPLVNDSSSVSALEDFRLARRQADLQHLIGRMTQRSNDLLNYEEVRRALRATIRVERGLQEIPLDDIVGSVGRYADFTRTFLPRSDSMQERWTRVRQVATVGSGWPPIQVYKLGHAYFVLDGNHRVSVAHSMGMDTIQAFVTEVVTKVPLSANVQPDELIVKARYAEFLQRTNLDDLRPEADLSVTAPGGYRILDEYIAVHRYYLGLEQQRDISDEEAVTSWYDHVYLPVIAVIRERGILCDFPDRTETDLYIWLSEYQAQLQEALGWSVSTEDAATDLVTRESEKKEGGLTKVGERLVASVVPAELLPGPEPGEWRRQQLAQRYSGTLFSHILIPISGSQRSWQALEQAIVIAHREKSHLRGLHVSDGPDAAENPDVAAIRQEFTDRCQAGGVSGSLVISSGPVTATICERARWNDLVVINLTYPPGETPLTRLSSGIHQMVQRCPRPMLAVPHAVPALERALLAYDGSPKAEEALFMATYLAEQWRTELVVVIAGKDTAKWRKIQQHARDYLELHEVIATFVVADETPAELVQQTAVSHQCDLIIIGGYGAQPVLTAVLGSTADEVLRRSSVPVLVCQ